MKLFLRVFTTIVLLSLGHTNAQAACGTVEVAKGDIRVEKSGGTISPIKAGSKICSGDAIIAAVDSRAKIRMEDGNELNVSPNSKILLENYQFEPSSNRKKVLLNILKGKVRTKTKEENMYNDKAKDGQANTFRVKTKSAVAGVRGTDFLTSYDPASNKSQVVTFTGRVEVGQPGPNGQILNPVLVGAGQKTEVTAGLPPLAPQAVPPAEFDQIKSESTADPSASAGGPSSDRGTIAKEDESKGQDEPNSSEPQSETQQTSREGSRNSPQADSQNDDSQRNGTQNASNDTASETRPQLDREPTRETTSRETTTREPANKEPNKEARPSSETPPPGRDGLSNNSQRTPTPTASSNPGDPAQINSANPSANPPIDPALSGRARAPASQPLSSLPSSIPAGPMVDTRDLTGGAAFGSSNGIPAPPGVRVPLFIPPVTSLPPNVPVRDQVREAIQNKGPNVNTNVRIGFE